MGLKERPSNAHKRFVRKDNRTLGYRVDVASEAEACQMIEEVATEEGLAAASTKAPEMRDVLRLETQPPQNLESVVQSRGEGVAATERQRAKAE